MIPQEYLMDLTKLDQLLVGRCISSPEFLLRYGELIRKNSKYMDGKMVSIISSLLEKNKEGLVSTENTFKVIADTKLRIAVEKIGYDFDTSIQDEPLFTLYMRNQLVSMLLGNLTSIKSNGLYLGKTWNTTLDQVREFDRLTSPSILHTDRLNSEISILDAQKSVYNDFVQEVLGKLSGRVMTSGIPALDDMGYIPVKQDVYGIIGQSGAGKSQFLGNLALENSKRGFMVLYVSLEMTAEKLMRRIEPQMIQSVPYATQTVVPEKDSQIIRRKDKWRFPRQVSPYYFVKSSTVNKVFSKAPGIAGNKSLVEVNGYMVDSSGNINSEMYEESKRVRRIMMEAGGDVVLKTFTIESATLDELDRLLDEKAKQGVQFDIVILDYMSLLKGSEADYKDRLMALSIKFKKLTQKHNVAGINVHQANDRPSLHNKGTKERYGEFDLKYPLIEKSDIFGSKSILNEMAVALGLNAIVQESAGIVINIIKTREGEKLDKTVIVKSALPAHYCYASYAVDKKTDQPTFDPDTGEMFNEPNKPNFNARSNNQNKPKYSGKSFK